MGWFRQGQRQPEQPDPAGAPGPSVRPINQPTNQSANPPSLPGQQGLASRAGPTGASHNGALVGASSADERADISRKHMFLPGAEADESLHEGRGFVVLGGPQPQNADIPTVVMDEEGVSYVMARGRRLLAEAPDMLPKDAHEARRIDFEHHFLRATLGGNYAAPLAQATAILDVGCGVGRWAAELATLFPSAQVVGFDIVTPPPHAIDPIPPNYRFTRGDALAGLPFPDASFDYTHMRLLYTALPARQWAAVVRDLARVTAPGGWLELLEGGLLNIAGAPTGAAVAPALAALNQWIQIAGARRGIDLQAGAQIGVLMQRAGLVNITFREIYAPTGHEAGRGAQMAATDAIALYEAFRTLVTAEGIVTPRDYDEALLTARVALNQRGSALPFYLAYGQRAGA